MKNLLSIILSMSINLFILLVITFLVGIPAVFGTDCRSIIYSSAVLDHDLFCPSGGPQIEAAGVVLDCQNYAIRGAGAGIGISMLADQGVVKNCTIEGFQSGIQVGYAFQSVIVDSSIQGNDVGIMLNRASNAWLVRDAFFNNREEGVLASESKWSSLENRFEGNRRDTVEIPSSSKNPFSEIRAVPSELNAVPSELIAVPSSQISDVITGEAITGAAVSLPQAHPSPFPVINRPDIHVIENVVAEDMLARVGVNPKLQGEINKKIEIFKSMQWIAGKATVVVVLQSRERVDNVVDYEIISKNMTQSAFDVSSPWPFTIVEHDPIIRFSVGALDPQSEAQISYTIDGVSESALVDAPSPSSILSLEEPSMVLHSQPIDILFSLFLVSFVFWCGLEWHAHQKARMVLHAGSFVLLLTLFWMIRTKSVVIISNSFHNTLLGIGLIAAIVFYGIHAYLMVEQAEQDPSSSSVDSKSK